MSILATHDYQDAAAALAFLKRTRAELRTLRRVHVGRDWLHVIDINRDIFEIRGIGYGDAGIIPLLNAVHTAFDPATIHEGIGAEYKEFDTGRRYPWAQDRVM